MVKLRQISLFYMFIKEVAFLEGRFLSIQSKQFKKLPKSSDWLEKIRLSKKHFIFGYVNRLIETMPLSLHFMKRIKVISQNFLKSKLYLFVQSTNGCST